MTQSIERFREQLVDYLYGELEGASLREFEASLRGSEQCRRELEAMKETLRISREGVLLLRALDGAAPSRVSSAVLAAAVEGARERAGAKAEGARERAGAKARGLVAEPPAAGASTRQSTPSLWSWLRTPWLLPTLGVAAAVSIVVLHKRVETPKMPGYESVSEGVGSRAEEPRAATERSDDKSGGPAASDSYAPAPASPSAVGGGAASPLAQQAEPVASAEPRPEGAAPDRMRVRAERKRDQAAPRSSGPSADRLRAAEQAEEELAPPAPAEVAASDDQGAPSKGYAIPPPAWTGKAPDESAKKEASEARRASTASSRSEQREAAPEQDTASGSLAAGGAARGAGGSAAPAAPAAKPTSPTRAASSAPAPAQPAKSASASAPAPGAPADDARPVVAAEPTTRAPEESVKRALEHMTARRFSQAAVAYRELLARYPKDPRAPDWRKQVTEAMQALSRVDKIP